MIFTEPTCSTSAFATGTGWEPKPEGLCQGDICVPAPGVLLAGDRVDIAGAARALGMPIVTDEDRGVSACGPATLSGRALTTAVAADPPLQTFDGHMFHLSSLRGRKVILAAWASY